MLLVFDWDGTLADSRHHIVTAMQYAIKELRLPEVSDADCASKIGLGLGEAASSLFPMLDAVGVESFCTMYSEHFLRLAKAEFPLTLFDGVYYTLEILAERGYPLAIATGKSRRGLDRVLGEAGLSDVFVATRTADETASKPNPKMLNELLQVVGKSSEEALMIGDTSYDLEMAQRAGVASIGVSYGVHDTAILNRYQPVTVLDKLTELLDWLELD